MSCIRRLADTPSATFALLKRQAAGSSGVDEGPVSTTAESPVRDLPGLGDEAFIQLATMDGVFSGADSSVRVRSGRLLLEVEYRLRTSELTDAVRNTPYRAARYALENLGS